MRLFEKSEDRVRKEAIRSLQSLFTHGRHARFVDAAQECGDDNLLLVLFDV